MIAIPARLGGHHTYRENGYGGVLGAHPGSEAFYVLTGRLGQKTPHGEGHVEAGGRRDETVFVAGEDAATILDRKLTIVSRDRHGARDPSWPGTRRRRVCCG